MPANMKTNLDGDVIYAGTKPAWWDADGTYATGRKMDVDFALAQSRLGDYYYEERQIVTATGGLPITSHKSVWMVNRKDAADDRLVGVVGKDRAIFQPRTMLEPLNALADEAKGGIVSIGALRDGQVIFGVVEFPDQWEICGRPYKGFLFGRDSVDGSSALDIRPTFICVVCENTYNAALSATRGIQRFVLPHRKNAEQRISVAKVRDAIGMVPEYGAELKAAMEALYAEQFSIEKFFELADDLFGKPDPEAKTTRSKTIHENRKMELARLWKADTQEHSFSHGHATKLTAYDALGEYLDHSYGSDKGRLDRQVMGGHVAALKTKALLALKG